jgi:beta-lactam-binding protein with PASTA domain
MASKGISAIGRLAAMLVLAAAFLLGLTGVVYMSLQGREVKVPEITGKDLSSSEDELAALGLKIKKRADRVSHEPPNTVIEQLPKPGETVKTGQMILVVTSKGGGTPDDAPASLKSTSEEEEKEKIEELISDKPKKPKANTTSTRKKADTARDVSNTSNSNTPEGSDSGKTDKKDAPSSDGAEKGNKNTQTPSRTQNPGTKPPDTKPRVPVRP